MNFRLSKRRRMNEFNFINKSQCGLGHMDAHQGCRPNQGLFSTFLDGEQPPKAN
jgi:hypothetical protein